MAEGGRQLSALPVHVFEDHDEALVHIYRMIGAKKLPFSGNCLVHFDSHPDLLLPDMKADEVFNKDVLFAQTSIADWIIPAVYAGHLDYIVWLKPCWSQQIQEGTHELVVGKESTSGKLRVATPLPYFISELLCVAQEQLENCRTVVLHVFTVPLATSPLVSDSKPSVANLNELGTQLRTVIHSSSSWMLDFDLDFFSTSNPFRDILTEQQFQYLKELYKLELPKDPTSNKDVAECVRLREGQLKSLELMWASSSPPAPSISHGVTELRELIGSEKSGKIVEANDIHLAGMMTDLPVHISSEAEIKNFMVAVKQLLLLLTLPGEELPPSHPPCPPRPPLPALVTIARSSEDEYTPPSQVEELQRQLLVVLAEVFPTGTAVTLHYQAE